MDIDFENCRLIKNIDNTHELYNKNAVQKRVEFRKAFKENFFPETISINNNNFSVINNIKNLMNFHFKKFNIPFIDNSNSTPPNDNLIDDFRCGERFKTIQNSNVLKYGNIKNYYVSIFMDDTKLGRKIKVVYLCFINDLLTNKNKKCVYTICCIDVDIYKIIKAEFYQFLVQKFQNEITTVLNNVKGNIFSFIADNLEANDILNLKNCFIKKDYCCRCCDATINNISSKLNNFNLKSNSYYLDQIKLNSRDKNLSKINKINGVSPFLIIENFEYVSSVVIEIQHTENEGELFRDLVLFFLKFPNLINDNILNKIKIYLHEFFNVNPKKIDDFFNSLDEYKTKIFEKDNNMNNNTNNLNNIINNNNSNEINISIHNNTNNLNNNNSNENNSIINNKNKNKNKNKNFKIQKKKPLGSSDIYYLYSVLIVFYYDFMIENLDNDIIKIYLCHLQYYLILYQNSFKSYEIDFLIYLVKQRIQLMLKNNIKVVPKTLLTLHYDHFIHQYGPLKYFTSFIFENHNHTIKLDVPKTSKNLSITALKMNYMFFQYQRSIFIPKFINFSDKMNEINYLKFSNHLIKPNSNAIFLGIKKIINLN